MVRFKGGDSFVFGRGFEEVDGLPGGRRTGHRDPRADQPGGRARRWPGIPVTHRGVAHEFTVISGHLPPGHPDSLTDWDAVARLRGTLRADDGGRERARRSPTPCSPAAASRTPRSRSSATAACRGSGPCSSTLGDLAADLAGEAVQPPAIIVVGDVVAVAPTPSATA